jgi:5-methylcytosine-specific restriction endonuclease McrA
MRSYYNSSPGICRQCFKKKRGRFMLTSHLCKKCGAKQRTRTPNPLIDLVGVVITTAVERRLRKKSTTIIPYTLKDHLASGTLYIAFFAIAYIFFTGEEEIPYFYLQALVITTAAFGFNFLLGRERVAKINSHIRYLARKRENTLHEQRTFYTSTEWRKIRNEIIAVHKNVCQHCGHTIRRKIDITVDHIKPRSKFPELALKSMNLRVLCRPCNSAKGARSIEEMTGVYYRNIASDDRSKTKRG